MASVSSLDQDMRKLRLDRYTPQAANEIRSWIESTLGEKLPPGDLLEALKDGTALCRLVNLAIPPPGVKFKKSPMPFVQMENISHFLRACEAPPLNMPAHDRFLTVDLYESKDPAQVVQCIVAFSRAAHAAAPSRVHTTIGPKRTAMSPTTTGSNGAERALSPALTGGSSSSRATNGGVASPGGVSSWSKKSDQGATAPAWNIAQYGYMGGASQGNQGVAFGARRQITSAAPHVPSLAEKEKLRREREAEDERQRLEAEEAEQRRRAELEEQERRAKEEEERRWEAEARRQREEEKAMVEQQKREWEEQERQWKQDEERRAREDKEARQQVEAETKRKRALSDARLRGQYLSEYNSEQSHAQPSAESDRVRELERQLEEAKERERQYQREREERLGGGRGMPAQQHEQETTRTAQPMHEPRPAVEPETASEVSWAPDEREYLRQQWKDNQPSEPTSPPSKPALGSARPLPDPKKAAVTPPAKPFQPARPLPEPKSSVPEQSPQPTTQSSRPLPDPTAYQNRTSRFLSSNPAPAPLQPRTSAAPELTSTNERAAEDARRTASQTKTKAGGWASKSLLEREMERERERQREWEEAHKESAGKKRDEKEGVGPGQSWDVHQYGYTGGDSQNRGGGGIGFGGRRQIIGPRPPP